MNIRLVWALFLGFCRPFLPTILAQDTIPDWERSIGQVVISSDKPQPWEHTLPVKQILSLAERIQWENLATVRSIGPGALATLSIRGAGPNRSPVLWNGLNLQSPMNGVMDLALIPLWPDDQFELQAGAQVETPGTFGGQLLIHPGKFDTVPGWKGLIQGATGSFDYFEGVAALGFSGKTYAGKLRGAWQTAENDFSFVKKGIDGKNQTLTQSNNALRIGHIQQFNRWNIRTKDTVSTAFWYHDAFREIPPAGTESFSNSWQEDRNLRFTADWTHRKNEVNGWNARVAGTYDFLAFRLGQDIDTSVSPQLRAQWEYFHQPRKGLHWRYGFQELRQWARSDGYTDTLQWYALSRLAGYGLVERRADSWHYSLQMRQELAENHEKPLTWQLEAGYGKSTWGWFDFQFARNVNLPTFNEKNWKGLGRQDINPEKGFSTEIGWRWDPYPVSLDIKAFHLTVDDWILWSPDSSGFFRPDNLRKVWSRGLEFAAKWEKPHLGRHVWNTSFGVQAQYSRSTNTAVYDQALELLGRQLPYTPNFSGGINLKWYNTRFAAAYLHQFTGKRLDNAGKSLRGFQTGNLLLSATFRQKWHVDLRLENLFNTRYEIIRYRPMPGINWRLGLRYQW